LLSRQVAISRKIVTKLLDDRLSFSPRPEDGACEFTGRVTIGRFLQGIVLPQVWRPHPDARETVTLPVIEIRGIVAA
jgi:hypothetical protein